MVSLTLYTAPECQCTTALKFVCKSIIYYYALILLNRHGWKIRLEITDKIHSHRSENKNRNEKQKTWIFRNYLLTFHRTTLAVFANINEFDCSYTDTVRKCP